jgi:hypothetical protein
LNNLREFAASLCSDDESKRALFQNGYSIEKLFATVRQTLLEPTAEQIQLAEHKAQEVIEELEHLLDKCSGGYVPNYYDFYPAAFQLLEEGPTHVLASRIATQLENYRQKLESLSSRKGTAEDRITFQKMKLLIGFVEQVPPEIKAMIYE